MTDGPRILIVDDEPNIRDLLTTSLRFAGFAVRAVGNGAHGEAGEAQAGREKVADVRFVINNENAGAISHDPIICALPEGFLKVDGLRRQLGTLVEGAEPDKPREWHAHGEDTHRD